MSRLLSLSVGILSIASACAAPIPDDPQAGLDDASTTRVARVTRDGRTTAIRGTVPTGESDPRRAAEVFLADHSAAIGVEDPARDLEHRETQVHPTTSTNPDAVEEVVVVYDGQQDGHRVYGSEVRVIVRNGEVVYAGGSTTEDASSLGTASIDAEGAFQILRDSADTRWQLRESELVAFNIGVFVRKQTQSVLAWLLEVENDEGLWRVFIDAQRSEELIRIPLFSNARRSSTYVREQNDAGLTYIDGELAPGATATEDSTAAAGYVGVVYDYFHDIHGRDGLDDAGGEIITLVDKPGLQNAQWTAERLQFGPGWLALDVLGHEYTHGVVDYSANFEYMFEAGALDESISDLFGHFASGDSDWLLGEDLDRGTLRSISQPSSYGQPQHYRSRHASGSFNACSARNPCAGSERCVTGLCINNGIDAGGVHTNSGITNYAMYLLIAGGSSAESGISVEGIGQPKVEHLIYRTLTTALGKTSDFLDLRFGMQNAAMCFVENDEYDFSYEDCGAMLNAMAAVGVGAPDRDSDCFDDEVDNCPCVYNPTQDPAACAGEDACGPQCELLRDCGDCGAQAGCGWCDGECEDANEEASCSGGSFDSCDETDACVAHDSCLACAETSGCGWCNGGCQSDASECVNAEGREVPYTHAEVCCGELTACGDCMSEGCSWCAFGACTLDGNICPVEAVMMCEPELTCESFGTCGACASTEGCGWGDDGCVVLTDIGAIGGGPITDPSRCEAADPCSVGTDCEMCAQTPGCGWGAEGCVTAAPGSPDVITRAAECVDCSGLTTCTPCATNGYCEWCSGSGCHNTYENACEAPTPVLACAIVELPD